MMETKITINHSINQSNLRTTERTEWMTKRKREAEIRRRELKIHARTRLGWVTAFTFCSVRDFVGWIHLSLPLFFGPLFVWFFLLFEVICLLEFGNGNHFFSGQRRVEWVCLHRRGLWRRDPPVRWHSIGSNSGSTNWSCNRHFQFRL